MISAYVLVTVEPGKNEGVLSGLRQLPGVRQAHACWGQPDIFTFVEADDDQALADAVLQAIQGVPGIRSTETHIVIQG